MKRVLVIGSGGSGKTTLSLELSRITGISVIHLDLNFWNPGWEETPGDLWRSRVTELCRGDRWIMDGNYAGTLGIRLKYADTVIFLDYDRVKSSLGVLKRIIRHHGHVRVDMPPGCPERFSPEFMKWVWNFNSNSRPKIDSALQNAPDSVTVYTLKNRRAMRRFLAGIQQ